MKVIFVTSVYAPNGVGGAERTVQTLAEMLVQRGHQACVVSLAPDGKASQGEINGVRTYYVPLKNIYWPFGGKRRSFFERALWSSLDAYNPFMAAAVGRILDQEKPDVLQTSNLLGFSVAVWKAAEKRKIPVVQMLHDYYLGCPNSSMFKGGHNCQVQCGVCRVFTVPRRKLSGIPVGVISLSQRMLTRLEDVGLFSRSAKKAIIHGASNFKTQELSLRPTVDHSLLTIGYLGRMEATKGIEVVLDAAMQVPGNRVRVLLGGSGAADYMAELRARYDSKNIEFIGFVKPAELFSRIDLLVVPSLWEEPLGRVIYEAYSYGIPSIVSRAGGMPEIIEEGVTGFVVNPGDAEDLRKLLERLAADWQGERFRAACLKKSGEFRVDMLIERYLDVWLGAAASSKSLSLQ